MRANMDKSGGNVTGNYEWSIEVQACVSRKDKYTARGVSIRFMCEGVYMMLLLTAEASGPDSVGLVVDGAGRLSKAAAAIKLFKLVDWEASMLGLQCKAKGRMHVNGSIILTIKEFISDLV